jgi:hypothetical protein
VAHCERPAFDEYEPGEQEKHEPAPSLLMVPALHGVHREAADEE